jgi:TPR repeat protein
MKELHMLGSQSPATPSKKKVKRFLCSSQDRLPCSMSKSWFRKLFSHPSAANSATALAPTGGGDAETQFGRGLKYASGTGAAQDYAQAAEWYRKAAAQNHSLAQFNLGMMYARGQGVTRDPVQSRMWFDRAAQQGDAGAQFNLGDSCQRASLELMPVNASESRIEAYKWFCLAAAQGYKGSQTACITMTLNMTRDDVAAGNRRVADFQTRKPASGRLQVERKAEF